MDVTELLAAIREAGAEVRIRYEDFPRPHFTFKATAPRPDIREGETVSKACGIMAGDPVENPELVRRTIREVLTLPKAGEFF